MSHFESNKNKLHTLIHSLTKNEKGYIKKYSKIFAGKESSKLQAYYEALEKMTVYNEVQLKKILDKQGGFSSYKNIQSILYDKLLEELVLLKIHQSPNPSYYFEHLKMQYLYNKGMYELSNDYYKKLDKCREIHSSAITDFLYYYNLCLHSKLLNPHKKQLQWQLDNYKKSADEIQFSYTLYTTHFAFTDLNQETKDHPKHDRIKAFKSFYRTHLKQLEGQFLQHTMQLTGVYYDLFCNYFYIIDDDKKMLEYSTKFYGIFNNDTLRIHHVHPYANAFLFYTNILTKLKRTEVYDVITAYENFIETYFSGKHTFTYLYVAFLQASLSVYTAFKDEKTLTIFYRKYADSYYEFSSNNYTKASISVNFWFFYTCFLLKKHKESVRFAKILLDTKTKTWTPKYYFAAKLIDICMHHQMGNFDNIEYYIKNLHNEVKAHHTLNEFEQSFFKLLPKVFYADNNNSKYIQKFRQLFLPSDNEAIPLEIPEYISISGMESFQF